MAVVHLATSIEGLRDVTAAVASTELLADEDPSLLTGPDRVQVHRVLSYLLPALARPGSRTSAGSAAGE